MTNGRLMVVTDNFCGGNMAVPADFGGGNMVVPANFGGGNMVVTDDSGSSNLVVVVTCRHMLFVKNMDLCSYLLKRRHLAKQKESVTWS
jgi:hypothetical protein